MASWGTPKNQQNFPINLKGFDENDLVMGVMLSQKHDLIQNCDLPPPAKIFSGSENKTVPISMITRKNKTNKNTFNSVSNQENVDDELEDGKLGLLKALRLSQTRAREAEAKCAAVSKERDLLALAFMDKSMQVYAYRHLVRLLEVQVSNLQKKKKKKEMEMSCDCQSDQKCQKVEDEELEDGGSFSWIMAVAFCLGIAGFGFALGCRYSYFI